MIERRKGYFSQTILLALLNGVMIISIFMFQRFITSVDEKFEKIYNILQSHEVRLSLCEERRK